ncbi:hypothetical protein RJ640_018430 [Escallonia rubra]|uniref:Uncharacterized protein n=1 Tax=Escallonia rubra TaxID=112253 RepID=A0AA88QI05_9ASTE|nr:hypothetical protein RJ640_018430 [Escallonia rubra]
MYRPYQILRVFHFRMKSLSLLEFVPFSFCIVVTGHISALVHHLKLVLDGSVSYFFSNMDI